MSAVCPRGGAWGESGASKRGFLAPLKRAVQLSVAARPLLTAADWPLLPGPVLRLRLGRPDGFLRGRQ